MRSAAARAATSSRVLSARARSFVLPAERVYDERTAVFHQQCADSLCAVTEHVIAVGRETRQLSLLDTRTGEVLDTSRRLPFSVYGTAVDLESGFLAVAGNERTEDHLNVALLRLQRSDDGGSLKIDSSATRTFGVGRLSRGSRNQANSVRFGCSLQLALREGADALRPALVRVVIVGSQDRSVYVYPVLAEGTPRALVQHRFETAVNCAAASPDGRWLAATGDTDAVYVVGSETGFLEAAGCERHALRLTRRQRLLHEQAGCQYCVWSADGQRLAASSDTLHAVAVWAVPAPGVHAEFVPLARFAEFPRPALALAFLPSTADGSHLLAWSELDSNVYIADVDRAGANDAWARPLYNSCGEREMCARGVQRIRLPTPTAQVVDLFAPPGYVNRITGLCCVGNALLVAQTTRISKFPILAAWSKEQHARFPIAFRRAVCTLLLGAAQSTHTDDSAPSRPLLTCLPKEVVLLIIAHAAMPRTCWLPARLSPEDEDARYMAQRFLRDRTLLTEDEGGDDAMLSAGASSDEDDG